MLLNVKRNDIAQRLEKLRKLLFVNIGIKSRKRSRKFSGNKGEVS